MLKRLRVVFDLLKTTFQEFNEDNAPRLAAALSYYTAFSIAPLLVITIAIVGLIVNQDTVRVEIIKQVQLAVGTDAATLVESLITNAMKPAEGIFSILLSIVALLLGAVGAFGNLQASLDIIWDIPPDQRPTGIIALVRDKILSFGMILIVGFLLLVSLVLSTVLAALNAYVLHLLPAAEVFAGLLNIVVSFAVTTALFALIYKYLPHVKLAWRDVLIGAAVTSLLFTIGRTLLGSYLASSGTASAYGAAGAFVLILLWIYYSSQIVLFGAEFTQVYARRYGSLAATNPLPVIVPPAPVIRSVATRVSTASGGIRDILFGIGIVVLALILRRGRSDGR